MHHIADVEGIDCAIVLHEECSASIDPNGTAFDRPSCHLHPDVSAKGVEQAPVALEEDAPP